MALLPIPYTMDVVFSVGSSVSIKGKPVMPFSMSPEMEVDFLTGPDMDSDIVFHFRVCFGKYVVMNSRKSGKWGPEVKSTVMPFENGQPFQVDISALKNEYQVTVNGAKSYTFTEGLDPGSVRKILVWKDVSLMSVTPQEKRM